MAYELFLEQLPFEAETSAEIMALHLRAIPPPPSEMWPDIPPQLERLLLAMLAKDPERRPSMLGVARGLEAVREELERRRQSAATAPPRTVVPIEAPQASGLMLAPTEPGASAEWRQPSRRWQYAVGVLALVASATMFLISRTDNQIADAATPRPSDLPDAAQLPADEASDVEIIPAVAAGTAPPPNLVATAAAATTPPAPRAKPPKVQPPAVRPERTRKHARKVTVAPHRARKLDPDGTLDPYR
jgi:serine/threonine-protein kinase